MNWTPTNDRQRRWVVAGAALAVNGVLLAAVGGLFHSASRMPWLAQTEDNAALLARCERIRGTGARHACVEAVVAAVQMRAHGPRLAAGPAAAPASAISR